MNKMRIWFLKKIILQTLLLSWKICSSWLSIPTPYMYMFCNHTIEVKKYITDNMATTRQEKKKIIIINWIIRNPNPNLFFVDFIFNVQLNRVQWKSVTWHMKETPHKSVYITKTNAHWIITKVNHNNLIFIALLILGRKFLHLKKIIIVLILEYIFPER